MTTENRETKRMLEGGSWKGCENVRNKELVVYSYEQRRMEATLREVRTLNEL
jgi:ribosomal protein L19E